MNISKKETTRSLRPRLIPARTCVPLMSWLIRRCDWGNSEWLIGRTHAIIQLETGRQIELKRRLRWFPKRHMTWNRTAGLGDKLVRGEQNGAKDWLGRSIRPSTRRHRRYRRP